MSKTPFDPSMLQRQTRRHFLDTSRLGLGAMALHALIGGKGQSAESSSGAQPGGDVDANPMAPKAPPRPARAKSVIYVHLSGAPPQQDLWDYKPKLNELHMQPCPDELLKNQKFAFIKGHPKMLGSPHKFSRRGEAGTWVSELLPGIGEMVDDIAMINSMFTDQFNHSPAELFLYTGAPRAGNASLGSWVTWGIGSENSELPGFVVLLSGGTDPTGGKSLWSNGFLPSVYQGVQCRQQGDPILYVSNPKGMDRSVRRKSLDALRELNLEEYEKFGDAETMARINQYELAFRMQLSVPQVMDIQQEPQHVLDAYGAKPGEALFANNCLQARRLVEMGVRFVQLYDWGWDTHGTGAGDDIVTQLPKKCQDVDRPIAALLRDLKSRGMLEETLVLCGGEFGRTSMNEARSGSTFLGRDHHPHCFSLWMAGGGVKGGITHGSTDELGYFITKDPVSIRDLQATILHLLGFDPYTLSFRYQGLDQRLIGPANDGKIRQELLA